MYVSAPPPPVLSVAVPAEISMRHGTESQPLKLAQYQIVRAAVAEGGMDKVVLNVGRHKFSADTEVPLKTGQELNLQVMATKPRIHLRIMEAAELKHLFRLLNSMGDNVKLTPLLKTLQSLAGSGANDGQALPGLMGRGAGLQLPEGMTAVLSQLARLFQASPGRVSGEDLAGMWQKLGLNLEALLAAGRDSEAQAGLKSVLFKAAPQLDQQGLFPDGLEKVMEQLNLFQLCRHRLAQENIFFLPLPFAFLEQGYLLAEREGGSGDEEEEETEPPWKMTLHLKLSVLGALEIKLLFEEESLRLRVLCDSKDKAEMVSRAIPRLADRLTTVSLKGYSVDAGAEEPVASLVKRLVPDGKHFLEAQV